MPLCTALIAFLSVVAVKRNRMIVCFYSQLHLASYLLALIFSNFLCAFLNMQGRCHKNHCASTVNSPLLTNCSSVCSFCCSVSFLKFNSLLYFAVNSCIVSSRFMSSAFDILSVIMYQFVNCCTIFYHFLSFSHIILSVSLPILPSYSASYELLLTWLLH